MKHTKTPWKRMQTTVYALQNTKNFGEINVFTAEVQASNPKEIKITAEELEANAKFIVRAVNSHEELLAAAKNLYRELYGIKPGSTLDVATLKLLEAIKKAKGA